MLTSIPQHNRRLGTNQGCILRLCFRHDRTIDDPNCILKMTRCLANIVSHTLFKFVAARASALTVHNTLGLPIRIMLSRPVSTSFGEFDFGRLAEVELAEVELAEVECRQSSHPHCLRKKKKKLSMSSNNTEKNYQFIPFITCEEPFV